MRYAHSPLARQGEGLGVRALAPLLHRGEGRGVTVRILTHGAAILVYVKITRPHDVPIVEAVGLRKTYGAGRARLQALRDVTLSIRRGEMVAIVGPSGCGKTTLLNVLSGLDEPDAGEVRVDGTPLHVMTDRGRTAYRARPLGFIFQSYNLLPVL